MNFILEKNKIDSEIDELLDIDPFDSDSDSDSEDMDKLVVKLSPENKKKYEKLKILSNAYVQAMSMFTNTNKFLIEGPKYMSIYIKSGKTIVLFGEVHFEKGNCGNRKEKIKDIIDYIPEILKNDTHVIDFYIEAPVVHLQTKERQQLFYNAAKEDKRRRPEEDVIRLVKLRDEIKWCLDRKTMDKGHLLM